MTGDIGKTTCFQHWMSFSSKILQTIQTTNYLYQLGLQSISYLFHHSKIYTKSFVCCLSHTIRWKLIVILALTISSVFDPCTTQQKQTQTNYIIHMTKACIQQVTQFNAKTKKYKSQTVYVSIWENPNSPVIKETQDKGKDNRKPFHHETFQTKIYHNHLEKICIPCYWCTILAILFIMLPIDPFDENTSSMILVLKTGLACFTNELGNNIFITIENYASAQTVRTLDKLQTTNMAAQLQT